MTETAAGCPDAGTCNCRGGKACTANCFLGTHCRSHGSGCHLSCTN